MPTLLQLRTRIKQRTDNEHVGSDFVSDTELNQLINTSYKELYGQLVRAGLDVSESVQTITATGAATYALATDYYSILGVFRVDSGYKYRLSRHGVRYRPGTALTGLAYTYRVAGPNIELAPTPGSGTYEVLYIPVPGELVADGDEMDGVLGWEEYVVVDVSIRVLQKEESDVTTLVRERERLLARIQDEAAAEEMTESWQIANTRSNNVFDPDARPFDGYRGPVVGPYAPW